MLKNIFLIFLLFSCSSTPILKNDVYNKVEGNEKYLEKKNILKDIDALYSNDSSNDLNFFEANYGVSNHIDKVIASFGKKNISFSTYDSRDYSKLYDAKGIINMSYGWNDTSVNMWKINMNSDFDKGIGELREFVSKVYLDNNYGNNDNLKIKSLGNSKNEGVENRIFSERLNSYYQVLGVENQKAIRNETIIVKNAYDENYKKLLKDEGIEINEKLYSSISNKIYYDAKIDSYQAQPLLLRALSVSENGYVKKDDEVFIGSSFSAPKVSRLAYELKNKYPFLSYNKIRQIILTTADHDFSGYLSDFSGWGQIDYEKALKGPSDFNAGLIDEEKFFVGMPSRIFDEEGNRYFYIDIDKGTYEWSNDIASGLSGDGNNKDYVVYVIKGRENRNTDLKDYHYSIAKVLDSERLYYSNIAQAGLRKDGKGTLILSGKQLYNTKTEIYDGSLILKNDSNSNYYIAPKGELILDKEHLILNGDIINNGKVEFKKSIKLKKYISSKTSKTVFHSGTMVEVDSFNNYGDIEIIIEDGEKNNLEDILKINGNIDENIELANIFLDGLVKRDNERVILSYSPRKIKDLSREELRNIPSYNYNEYAFFKEYEKELKNNNEIFNIVSNEDKEMIKSKLFTSIYADYVRDILKYNEKLNLDKYTNMYVIVDKFENNSNILNSSFNLGYIYNNENVTEDIRIGLNFADLKRELLHNEIKNKIFNCIINNKLTLKYDYVLDGIVFTPFLEINSTFLRLFPSSENFKLGLDILDNVYFKNKVSTGIDLELKKDKIRIKANFKIGKYLDEDVYLLNRFMGIKYMSRGKNLDKYNFNISFSLNYEL